MPDDAGTTRGQECDVREVGGGRRIFKANRLSSGNWLLVEKGGANRRTINNEAFCNHYERVPHFDR